MSLYAMGASRAHPAGHQDEPDRQPFWDVVDGEGKGDEHTEGPVPAERHPYRYPFREGVQRHDRDDQQRLAGTGLAHLLEARMYVALLDYGPREDDEGEAEEHPQESPPKSMGYPFVYEPEARREHQPRRQGVRGAEPLAGGMPGEDQRRDPEPGRQGRRQREEKYLYSVRHQFRMLPRSGQRRYPLASGDALA